MSGSQQLLLGGVKAAEAAYIEDVFSTYLYTGNGSTQTITNGIDLAGKGGLVWVKSRSAATSNHALFDSARGANNILSSNTTSANTSAGGNSLNANGFDITNWLGFENANAATYASWTFRKQPKFFDVVTWTGDGTTRSIPHSLGSVPGAIIVKNTSTAAGWAIYHRSLGNAQSLDFTTAAVSASVLWASTDPTSTNFTVANNIKTNTSGETYVAYLFAHNAGGFGLTGTDNVISCGSFTTAADGSASVTLGYEPQWILVKKTNGAEDWTLVDSMRGMPVDGAVGGDKVLFPNLSSLEQNHAYFDPSATGFSIPAGWWLSTSSTYIYIAIRRGPMKTPTSGTSVFAPAIGANLAAAGDAFVAGFPVDLAIQQGRLSGTGGITLDRLRGSDQFLNTSSTGAETSSSLFSFASNTALRSVGAINVSSRIGWLMRRAPGFFDEVCYTGNGGSNTLSHNLGTTPQMAIVKSRSAASAAGWFVNVPLAGSNNVGYLNLTNSFANSGAMSLSSTGFSYTAGFGDLNASGTTYVAYLFATCPGVSKVGSYTGNGTSAFINCGFVSGARFVMIKRTDATGGWYVWDTARGIASAGGEPHLLINSTSAEVTNQDSLETLNSGFIAKQNAVSNINVSGATYIYLAIA